MSSDLKSKYRSFIQASGRKNKKYKFNNGLYQTHFGDSRYQQFEDSALGLFSHKDHKDQVRRKSYYRRHSQVNNKKEAIEKEKDDPDRPSSKLLSHMFLW